MSATPVWIDARAILFLAVNGWRLETTQIDAIETMLSLARGTLDESSLSSWIRGRIVRDTK